MKIDFLEEAPKNADKFVMLEIAKSEVGEISFNTAFVPPKYNRMWGAEYMFMDSKAFMGKEGREAYEIIINMFNNLWNSYNYQLLNNLRL